jgi:hypothetical protein
MASGTPLSGYVPSMTGVTLPASMSSFRRCKSSDLALAMIMPNRWLTNGDSASARCEFVLPGRCVFGEGAGARAEHLVADLEPAHVRTDRLDDPSDIRAPNTSLGRAQPESHHPHQVWLTRHGVLVTDMDPSRPNPDKQLVVGDLGLRNLREPQNVGGAIGVLHDRLHRGYSRRRPLRVANHGSGLGFRCHELFLSIR